MPTDHYIVGNCIGRGNFGAVFRAIHLESLKTVAIKRVPVPDTEQLTTMMREVRKMESLHHENVVRYHGFIRTASEFNLILEYVENGSLASTLKHFGPLPEVVVLDIVYQVLQGLNYLHERELKHLDIKAANLLYTKDGQVKLSDFGVSQSAMDTHSDKFVGTAYWMAPEVIALDGPCTASDIWSLGCTIIELLTGVPPYFDMIPMSALYKIVEDDAPPLPEDISPDLHHFMLCCFQKNPAHRWSAHALLAHDWI
ncbi:kinase-like domain-containing protein, partial [Blastocladiella britannica]